MRSTQLRRDHIHGMITGVAIGDALGYARSGLTPRQAIKVFGSGPGRYSFRRNVGVTGFNSAQVFMAAQSVVSSGTELEQFGETFLQRLAWYAVSFPTDMDWASRRAGLMSWFRWIRTPRPSRSISPEPAVRSILLVLALHNTNLGTRNWVENSVRLTHVDSLVVDGCQVLAGLTKLIIKQPGELNAPAAAKQLADSPWNREYSDRLKLLPEFLEEGRRSSVVAKHFGWTNGIPAEIVPTVIMSIYCFLRHHKDFRRAVDAVIRLGGDTSTTGAIVGALMGASWGIKKIPQQLVSQLSDTGYGPTWIEEMAYRLSEWPHGVDDLMDAPALRANPISVLRGNIYRRLNHISHSVRRIPSKFFLSPPARIRHAAAAR